VGGRLLPDGPGKSAQLMYQDAQGLRVTVYLRKPEVGTPAAFRYERQGELGLFYWVESGAGYALVGACRASSCWRWPRPSTRSTRRPVRRL
jgi:anti-sigma factor RsiW